MGFRFFKGYYLQTLPALVWMVGAIVGKNSWFTSHTPLRTRVGISLLLLSIIIPFAKTDIRALKQIRHQRHTARDLGVQRLLLISKPIPQRRNEFGCGVERLISSNPCQSALSHAISKNTRRVYDKPNQHMASRNKANIDDPRTNWKAAHQRAEER